MRRAPALAVVAAGLALAVAAPAAAAPVATEFSAGITVGALGITLGGDGNLWYGGETFGNKVGRITPSGSVTEFTTGITSSPRHFATGEDGSVWFTERLGNKVGRITPDGTVNEFSLTTPGSNPVGIAAGPDGRLWVAQFSSDSVAAVNTAGGVIEYPLPANADPFAVTAGPDGRLWVTETGPDKVATVNINGTVVAEYALPANPRFIAIGSDGNVWVTLDNARVARVTPAGDVVDFPVSSDGGASPEGIVSGADGALWAAQFGGNRLGRVATDGGLMEFSPFTTGGNPGEQVVGGPDGDLWMPQRTPQRIARVGGILDPPGFANRAPVALPATGTSGDAKPYPSTIQVSGLQGTVTKVRARLLGMGHADTSDLDLLLVGPQGQTVVLASDIGNAVGARGVTTVLDDGAALPVPTLAPLVSGPFKPTDAVIGTDPNFTAPAPAGPYGATLSVFNGTDPNGAWRLFGRDDSASDVGHLWGGWALDIETTGPPPPPPVDPGPGDPGPQDPGPQTPTFGSKTNVSLSIVRSKSTGKLVAVNVKNGNAFAVTGTLGGKTTKKLRLAAKRLGLTAKAFTVAAGATKLVRLSLPSKARTELASKRTLSLALVASVVDPAAVKRSVPKTIVTRLPK